MEQLQGQRIWITGATGGLGQSLTHECCKRGAKVFAVGRDRQVGERLQSMGAIFLALDLVGQQVSDWQKRFQKGDRVIHCAARSSPWGDDADFERINVQATKSLANAAHSQGVARFVFVSSPSVYFEYADRVDVKEDDPLPNPVNAYARSKRQAELQLQSIAQQGQGLPTVVIRPRAIFGPHDQVLIPRILKAYRSGRFPLIRQGQAVIDVTHMDNVVHALMLALTCPLDFQNESYKVFNISNDEPMKLVELLDLLFGEFKWPVRYRPIPWSVIFLMAHLSQCWGRLVDQEPILLPYTVGVLAFGQSLNIQKAKNELGYSPVISVQKGMAQYVQWARTHQPQLWDLK